MDTIPNKNQSTNSYSFQPLIITVCGKAGTGKGFLIHTITSMLRQMTSYNGTVILCGPTGASACNINGKTIHSHFGLNPFNLSRDLSRTKQLQLKNELKRALIIIIDERSMISSEILSATENNFKNNNI